jgi:hypothetical protein
MPCAERRLPYEYKEIGTGEPIESENLMVFRLLYQGPLPSSGNQSNVKWKHELRRSFHPQLRRLWSLLPNLRQYASYQSTEGTAGDERFQLGLKAIGRNWNVGEYDFVPLVTKKFALRCSLDILLLRPGEEQFILKQGDIDGQVKTLFDALKKPGETQEMPGNGPEEDERPFFCLLEDDRLITEVHVNAEHLLLLPGHKDVQATDSFVVIHVKINHRHPGTFDRWFD